MSGFLSGTASAVSDCAAAFGSSPLGQAATLGNVLAAAGTVLAVLVVHRLFLRRGWRRAPTRPPRAAERTYKRGSGKEIPCENPSTGARLGVRRAYTPEEVRAAYTRASVAQREWAETDFDERRAVLVEISDWVLANADTVRDWSTTESGKTRTEAVLGELMMTCEKIRWLCAEGEQHLQPEYRSVPSLLMTKSARVEFRPVGVVGAIVPFNYPVFNQFSAITAAIFAGNGMVIKASEWSSFSAELIEDVLRGILARRGHNPDLVQIVTGYGETGAALVESGVETVLFIGSPEVGRLVMRAASARLTPVILELGGCDPFIVFDDCDFDHMVDIAVRAAFINNGLNCVAGERFYVQEGIRQRFVDEMTRRVAALRQGSSNDRTCDFGSITMPAQAAHVAALVDDAVKKGARVAVGGQRFYEPQESAVVGEQRGGDAADSSRRPPGRCVYFQPTVLDGVTHDMRVANEEAFGPLMPIISFRDEDHLVEMVNTSVYGLGCSVFTKDYKKADRVTARIECGMVTINDFASVPTIGSLPFGGCKDSGFGAFNGREGLRGFSRAKSVVTDRFGVRADTPGFLKYPVAANSHQIALHAIRMIYGDGWGQAVSNLVRMVRSIATGSD